MFLSPVLHQMKTRAVDKWLNNEDLTDAEMEWIDIIRKHWADTKDHMNRFRQFKTALDDILEMDDYYNDDVDDDDNDYNNEDDNDDNDDCVVQLQQMTVTQPIKCDDSVPVSKNCCHKFCTIL